MHDAKETRKMSLEKRTDDAVIKYLKSNRLPFLCSPNVWNHRFSLGMLPSTFSSDPYPCGNETVLWQKRRTPKPNQNKQKTNGVIMKGLVNFSSTFRLLDEGLCNIRVRPCLRTIVFGQYFLSSENLTCHVKEFKVKLYFILFMFSR